MTITRLVATKVHGYIEIDINFFRDLTFVIGLNGSGKTSALRLIVGLLTPDLSTIDSIEFETVRVSLVERDKRIDIAAVKSNGILTITVSAVNTALKIPADLLTSLLAESDEDIPTNSLETIYNHEVFSYIKSLPTPTFLSLDRRFSDRQSEHQRYQIFVTQRRKAIRSRSLAPSIVELNEMVRNFVQTTRSRVEVLDDNLRKRFFINAFAPISITYDEFIAHRAPKFDDYKATLQGLEKHLETAGLEEDIREAFARFHSDMHGLLERFRKQSKSSQMRFEWMLNLPRIEKAYKDLKVLLHYEHEKQELWKPQFKCKALVNKFLAQCGKEVQFSDDGEIKVSINGISGDRGIHALSSGERQILTILAHLSFNPTLEGSGVFIVDEPELSLHMAWQEIFVNSIQQANPSVQLILATHSPAIILDRQNHCKNVR